MLKISNLRRNVLYYRLTLILGGNGMLVSVVYFFFTEIKYLSAAEALFLIGLGALSKALAEVPTGVVADKFSRKYSIFIGYLMALLAWIAMLFAGQFWLLTVVTAIRGVAGSFISGADEALLYDSLKELREEKTYKQIYSLSESIMLVSFALTIFIGGLLGSVNLLWPIYANILLLAGSAIVSLLFVEPGVSKQGEKLEQKGYLTHTKDSLKSILSNHGVLTGLFGAFVSLGLVSAVFKSTKTILSPVLEGYEVDLSVIGFIVSSVILIKAVGAFLTSRFSNHKHAQNEIKFGLGFFISGLVIITLIQNIFVQIVIFVLILCVDNLITTNLKSAINENIDSNQRSTIFSLLSLLAKSLEMVFLSVFGFTIASYSINVALFFTIGWLVIGLLIFGMFSKK